MNIFKGRKEVPLEKSCPMLAGEQVVIIEGDEQNRKLTKVISADSEALFSPSDPTHLMVLSTGPPTWPGNNVEMSCFLTPPIPVP